MERSPHRLFFIPLLDANSTLWYHHVQKHRRKGPNQSVYLKRLEMLGFKSFASRTVLEFSPGITAVVGPNGAGKSNVADSMRWVLGEQSMRQLRGKKSDDIIFAGGHGRSQLGMA